MTQTLIRATAARQQRYGYPASTDRLAPETWVVVTFGLVMFPLVVVVLLFLLQGTVADAGWFAVMFIGPMAFRIFTPWELSIPRVVAGVLAGIVSLLVLVNLGNEEFSSWQRLMSVIVALAIPLLFVTTEKLHTWRQDDRRRQRFLQFLDTVQERRDVDTVCVIDQAKPNGTETRVLMRDAVTGQMSPRKSLWGQGWRPGTVVAVDPHRQGIAWTAPENLAAANAHL